MLENNNIPDSIETIDHGPVTMQDYLYKTCASYHSLISAQHATVHSPDVILRYTATLDAAPRRLSPSR